MKKGCLVLENGARFEGRVPEWMGDETFGEVVFTTGMTGYYESLTDPSYTGQILTFTYPLIGNYGVADKAQWESEKIHARGVIVSECCAAYSHHASLLSLLEWLEHEGVPIMVGVDTRELTKTLRTAGTMLGAIVEQPKDNQVFDDPNLKELVSLVSIKQQKVYGKGKKRVIVVDCGMKENIIRQLLNFPIELVRVPYDYDFTNEEYDGVFLSNGPGDPTRCNATIEILKRAMAAKKPIFGICLGSQLLALAAGAETYKLKFGHRGQNQPCIDVESERCYVTSQNHGYAVDEKSLPKGWKATFRNLNDGSVEGIAHETLPFSAVQFHPEAAPEPTDTRFLFERFYKQL
ncbi:MAG: Carbamoyl-phosphate synthase small chain [Chlamydiae bacterium]|nr:Carbamoyl-phosphate synthase small chain [Chlamydiota bacterium]